jgi:hypothetical protein
MRKMILGSVAVAAICVFAQPDRTKPEPANTTHAVGANHVQSLKTAATANFGRRVCI